MADEEFCIPHAPILCVLSDWICTRTEKFQWMGRNYTIAIKGFSILTVVWAHSGAMLSVGEIQFIAGIGVVLFLICSGYDLMKVDVDKKFTLELVDEIGEKLDNLP